MLRGGSKRKRHPASYYANATPGGGTQSTASHHPALQPINAGVAYDPAAVAPSQYGGPSASSSHGPHKFLPRSQFGSVYSEESPLIAKLEREVGPLRNPSSHELFNKYVLKSLARSYVKSLNQPYARGPSPGSNTPTSALPAFTPGPPQPSSAPAGAGAGTWTGGGVAPGGVAGPGSGEEPAPDDDDADMIEQVTAAPATALPAVAAANAAAGGQGGGAGGGEDPKKEAEEGAPEGEGKKEDPFRYGAGVNPGIDRSAFANRDRAHPITPETGAQQTVGSANSIVGADPIVEEAESTNPNQLMGNAEERANVGKGGYTGYEFCGPYDYPSRPSGRVDSTLTALGAWRSKTGEHQSSLWSSRFTEKGGQSKREQYYKWSTKGGGTWNKLSAYDASRTFRKTAARKEGARWMAQLTEGTPLRSLMASSLKHKMENIQMGIKGNELKNEKMYGDVKDAVE